MRRARTFPCNESRDQDTALSCLAPGFAVTLCLFHEACVPLVGLLIPGNTVDLLHIWVTLFCDLAGIL